MKRNTPVKKKVLPLSTWLSTQMRPPIISTRREQMARPRPVPPCLRVVDPSAWRKASKMKPFLSAGMPMPVSFTENSSVISDSVD